MLQIFYAQAVIRNMDHTVQLMTTAQQPDNKAIAAKQDMIGKMLKSVQTLMAQRQLRLNQE